jgi:putative DNA primase/helicase
MLEYRKLYPELTFAVLADDDRHLYQRLMERLAKHGIGVTEDELRQSMDRDWSIPDGPLVALKAAWTADPCGVMRIEGTLSVNREVRQLLLENAGQSKAHAAARRCKARVFTPFFVDRASKATDWNDLHCSAGLEAVREQLTTALDAPPEKPAASARAPRGGKGRGPGDEPRRRAGDEGGDAARSTDEGMPFLERFTLIYGTTTVWDAQERMIVRLEALKAAHGKRVDWWLADDRKAMVLAENVVFDPTGKSQPPDYVNLFERLPLTPVKARDKCVRIIRHIENICQGNDGLCHWVTAWLAYPLQHPGAKMRTALVLHGRTEGTGKSTLGDIMRRIYGKYATSVGQAELQRDFNDWLSAKLLVIGEEVVSRQDRAHHQGMLQALITQPRVQINTKNMPIREEANHANFMFFSNNELPLLLNARDRRFTVIRVEQERPPEYFEGIGAELNDGGAEAFLEYLLSYDLQGFNEFSRPFETRDRLHLITLSMAPDTRFFEFWRSGLAGVPFCTCPAADLYTAFKAWCRVNGERFTPHMTAFGRTISGELDRLQAPPKKVVRYEAYSDKQIADNDLKDTTTKQGIVYFVPARLEVMRARVDGDDDEREALSDPPPDVMDRAYVNKKVKLFQAQLAELLASARRSV